VTLWFKRITIAIIAAGAAIVFAGYVLPFFFPFSHLNWSEAKFDLCSGRLRHTSYFLGLCVRDTVEETRISRLYRERIGEPPPPRWIFMHGGGPWVIADGDSTPFSAARLVSATMPGASFTEEAETEILRTLFALLSEEEDGQRASDYAEAVCKLSTSRRARVCKIGPDDLPAPPERDPAPGSPRETP
jgi:hypothetical protein